MSLIQFSVKVELIWFDGDLWIFSPVSSILATFYLQFLVTDSMQIMGAGMICICPTSDKVVFLLVRCGENCLGLTFYDDKETTGSHHQSGGFKSLVRACLGSNPLYSLSCVMVGLGFSFGRCVMWSSWRR